MDLVASYDSEVGGDSDIEEIRAPSNASTNASTSNKGFDVIDLESDPEDGNKAKKSRKSSKRKGKSVNRSSKRKESSKLPSKVLDCIDLDGSDCEIEVTKKLPEKSNSISDSAKKKTDYLNLESTDSEIESESVPSNRDTLINTASILSDVPCGPIKPSEVPSQSSKSVGENSNLSQGTSKSTQSSNLSIVPNIQNQDSSQLETDIIFETTVLKTNNDNFKDETVSCIYKEDERVIQASQKNIVCRIPRQVVQTHIAHSNVVMSLNWCIPQYSHLFLSASLDCSLKVWDKYRKNPVQCIQANAGLNAAKWSLDGGQIVAGGNEKKALVYDVQTGKNLVSYDIFNFITSMETHPYMEDVFLCGTRNAILGFDIRVNTSFPIRSFFSKCNEVLDIAFFDENEFICSTNIVSHDSADRTIMAWDFASGAILSNQIFMERYTCPSLKVHPTDSSFVAQTNGGYIASFSTHKPYKIKNKRYVGHKVLGYGIECDISPDGKYLASGDAGGNVFFYNYSNTSIVLNSVVKENTPCNKIKWHPAFSSTMITSTYDGHIQLWK